MARKNSTPEPETVCLKHDQLAYLVHLGATTDLDDLERDDPEALRIIRQIGLFFAANPEMADYAINIDEITLTPGASGTPPWAALRVTHKRRVYHLETRPGGSLPSLPFETKKRRKKRWRKRKLNPTDAKG